MKNLIRLSLSCASALLLLLLNACGGGGDGSSGYVRLVNATSDFESIDLYQSTTSLTTSIEAYTVGDYVALDPASYTFNLTAGGASAVSASRVASVDANTHNTLVAYTTKGTLTTQYLTDSESAPTSGTAKFRVLHTDYADVGKVDVYVVTTNCADLPSSAAAAIASSLSGLQSAYAEVTATSAGSPYHVCVTAAGDKSDLRLDIPALTLTNQQIATLILTRTVGGTLLHGLLLNQQGTLTPALNTSARIRLAVGASSSAAVTATVNGVTLGTNLSAPAVTNYKLITAGALTTNVTVAGTAADASGLSAPAGADLTLLVTGTAASKPVLLVDDNTVSTSTTRPVKLRLVNGMTGAGTTALLTDDYSDVGGGAAFGAASAYSLVSDSAALARLEATYGYTQLCLSTDVTLTSGLVYTVFLLGDVPATAGTCPLRVDH